MPAVSVIIPVYGAEKYLRECLDSILGQTLKDIEIICVDDGSPDNCGKILDEYAAMDCRLKVIHQENKGIFLARKTGVLASTGDYLMFSDDDDRYARNACETAYNAIREKNVDILKFGMTSFSDSGDLTEEATENQSMWRRECGHLTTKKQIFDTIFNNSVLLWDKIFHGKILRNAYQEIAEFRILFGEDTYALIPIMWYADSMDSIPESLYFHRYGSGITTNKNYAYEIQQISKDFRSIPLLYDFVAKQDPMCDSYEDLVWVTNKYAQGFLEYFLHKAYISPDDTNLEQSIKNILDCLAAVPASAVKNFYSILSERHETFETEMKKKQKTIEKIYLDFETLQEKYDDLNNSKTIRQTRFQKHLFGLDKSK